MKRAPWMLTVAALLLMAAAQAGAQKGTTQQGQQQQQRQAQQQQQQQQVHQQMQQQMHMTDAQQREHAMRMERIQATTKEAEQLRERVRQTNQLMKKQHLDGGYPEMAQMMERTGEQLHLMLVKLDGICQDPAVQRDQDRLREMDQLHDRLHTMVKEMERARSTLAKAVGSGA
jgi:hypothetical protein